MFYGFYHGIHHHFPPTVGRICLKLFPSIEHANLYDLYQYIWDTPHFEVESADYKCPPRLPRVTRIHKSTFLMPMMGLAAMLGYSTQCKKKRDCLLTLHHKEVPKEDVLRQKKDVARFYVFDFIYSPEIWRIDTKRGWVLNASREPQKWWRHFGYRKPSSC